MPIRRLTALVATAALAALPAVAAAHSELVSSDPAAGATLETPPSEVVLTFESELLPDGTGFTVTDADGTEVGSGELDLDVAERNVVAGDVEIAAAGEYTVAWTRVAADGHEEAGEFTFTVAGEDGGGQGSSPDTALRADAGAGARFGILLLAAAAAIALRRILAVRASR